MVVGQQEKKNASQKVATLDHAASKVFYSRLLLHIHMVNIMCEMLLTIITLVTCERDLPDPINKKSLGLGQIFFSFQHIIWLYDRIDLSNQSRES